LEEVIMSAGDNLPDWLRQLRDQQLGAAGVAPVGSTPVSAVPTVPDLPQAATLGVQETQVGSSSDGFGALREKASIEIPEEAPPGPQIPIISQLSPFQRFLLALLIFLNVSVLGCLGLMVLGKITLMP